MTETLLKYFLILKTGRLQAKSVPKIFLECNDFQNMVDNRVILKSSAGRGYVYELNESRRAVYESWFEKNFPHAEIEVTDRASSVAKLKDSKRGKEKHRILFLRGRQSVKINHEQIDLAKYTLKFGFFASVVKSLEIEKICFVENKDTFLQAEKVISDEYVFVHSYGRIGKSLLDKIQTNEVLVFSDYDYVGLNEYLKCKSVFQNTRFFIPENYGLLFEKYAKEIVLNRKKGQKASREVLASEDKTVLRICKDLLHTQKFLEQESLLISL